MWRTEGPRRQAAAVAAKNMPQAYFLNATTVLQEIITYLGTSSRRSYGSSGFFCFKSFTDEKDDMEVLYMAVMLIDYKSDIERMQNLTYNTTNRKEYFSEEFWMA